MPYEGDACVVCKGTKSTNENPIIYCDGDDKTNLENQKCNMPVHKRCYHLKEVPEGDWYCQSCLNKVKKKTTNVVCCTTRDGALKPTDVPGKYMHIVCAMWNKLVPDKTEPYTVKESELGLHKCVYCPKKQGLCIQCEEPNCLTRFHVTCAIDKGILKAAAVVPDDYSPRCSKHQIKTKNKSRRLRKRNISDDESEEETEEETEEDEDNEEEDESDQDHEDNDDEDEEEEVEPEDKKNRNPLFMAPKKKLALSSNKLIAASASASITKPLKKEIPSKRRTHIEDSSDDDDMGTSNNKKPKNTNNLATYRKNSTLGISLNNNNSNSNNNNNNSNSNNNISNTNSVSNTNQQRSEGLSYRDRFKKPDLELIPSLLNEIKRPFSNPNPSPSTLDDHLRRQQQLQQQSQIQQPSPQQPNKNSPLVELNRLREEIKKLNYFKQKVAEVFLALNVPVPASVSSPNTDIESYVDYLRQTIQRVGPVKDEEMDQIKDYAELLVNKNKSK
ncbi:PHD-zinc-finger like domain-containing protein [Gilbertella persicaria]|uniref:PHD-zinc-finger like domain-containing protein n=1 Tax=Gilbertella persicaria TaxID=101096 RepID=UPI00221F3363|nr:PHD-zinc-finger like domain-containing protein [Gilbertella persicaria]KAI8085827.1 PHD-zinc-finger like domain-containing protein [Gilbertella persicaria]